jgi:hypothetical protein
MIPWKKRRSCRPQTRVLDTSIHRFLLLELCAPGGLYDGSRSPALTSALSAAPACSGTHTQILKLLFLRSSILPYPHVHRLATRLFIFWIHVGFAGQGMNCNLIYADEVANQQGTNTRLCRNMVIDS